MSYQNWVDSYSGDSERAAKDAYEAFELSEKARRAMRKERDQLRKALSALREDGAWIGGEWVPSAEAEAMADEALKLTEHKSHD